MVETMGAQMGKASTQDMMGFFTAVPNSVLMHPGIQHWTKLVLFALLSFARPSQGKMIVWPTLTTIAEHLGCSDDTVGRAMRDLVDYGIVTRKVRGFGKSAVTQLHPPDRWTLPLVREGTCGVQTPHPCGVLDRTHAPAEEDVIEEDARPLQGAPASTDADANSVPEEPRREIIPAEDTVPTRELLKGTKPPVRVASGRARIHSERFSAGGCILTAWDTEIAPECALERVPSASPGVRIKAAKTLERLRYTKWKGKTIEELTPLIVERIKAATPMVRKCLSFGMLFLTDKPSLERLLNGDWDDQRQAGADPREAKMGELG